MKNKILAMRRSFETSNGLLTQLNKENVEKPIQVNPKTMLTVDSTIKNGAAKTTGNIQKSDTATLSKGFTILKLSYIVKVVDPLSFEKIQDRDFVDPVNSLKESIKNNPPEEIDWAIKHLAKAYANKMVSAHATWRNRDLANSATTEIKLTISDKNGESKNESFSFDNVHLMGRDPFMKPLGEKNIAQLEKLSNYIFDALFRNDSNYTFSISHFLDMGCDLIDIYPSQMFTEKEDKLGRKLFSLDGTAAITSQKIGNALRTIDIFSGAEKTLAIYEYGNDLSELSAERTPKLKNSFSAIAERFLAEDSMEKEEWYFFIAILIKGGVWS